MRAHDAATPTDQLPAFTTLTTPSGSFTNSLVLTNIVAGSDGIIDLDIEGLAKALGGNGYWVLDGIDVWSQSSPTNDPGAAPINEAPIITSNPPTTPATVGTGYAFTYSALAAAVPADFL